MKRPPPSTFDPDMQRMLLALPPAIEPYYTQTAANSPVLLCRARVASKGEAGAGSHPGEFRLDWLPSPAIIADMYGEISPLTVEAVIRPATVTSDPELPRNQVPPPPRRRNARRSRSGSHWQERYISLEVGNADTTVERGLLHLVNWPELFGAMVRHPLGVGPDRNRLESDRWTVTIDRIWGAHDRVADAAATRGYALSHVAEVRRRDGECFGTDDLRDLNEASPTSALSPAGRDAGRRCPSLSTPEVVLRGRIGLPAGYGASKEGGRGSTRPTPSSSLSSFQHSCGAGLIRIGSASSGWPSVTTSRRTCRLPSQYLWVITNSAQF